MGNYTDTKRSRRSRREQTPGIRSLRLEELIREEMNLFLESEVTDPNLDGVRITTVSLSPDGARARLSYTMTYANTATGSRELEGALRRATGFFRRELCDALSLKRTPELRFLLDVAALGGGEDEETS
jgi:ribosome-binding factor A